MQRVPDKTESKRAAARHRKSGAAGPVMKSTDLHTRQSLFLQHRPHPMPGRTPDMAKKRVRKLKSQTSSYPDKAPEARLLCAEKTLLQPTPSGAQIDQQIAVPLLAIFRRARRLTQKLGKCGPDFLPRRILNTLRIQREAQHGELLTAFASMMLIDLPGA